MSEFEISTDNGRLDYAAIHQYLSNQSYWAKGIPFDTVKRSIEHSICFGVYRGAVQAGFARIITDQATFAYLADVFILEEYRGLGLSKRLMNEIMNHPQVQGLRRWLLATADAHGLYKQFGFCELAMPGRFLEIPDPDVYSRRAV